VDLFYVYVRCCVVWKDFVRSENMKVRVFCMCVCESGGMGMHGYSHLPTSCLDAYENNEGDGEREIDTQDRLVRFLVAATPFGENRGLLLRRHGAKAIFCVFFRF